MKAAAWIMALEKVQTLPIRFQGKPLKAQLRTHSNSAQAAAKTRTRPTPLVRLSLVAAAAAAGNIAISAESATGAMGASQPNSSGLVNSALAIQ